jgi:hypothetical protein
MELANQVICPCTGKTYKCLRSHFKTKIHTNWENEKELRELRLENKRVENNNPKHLLDIIETKNKRIEELEERVRYLESKKSLSNMFRFKKK